MIRALKPSLDKPMSYILDALKRADAERERGAVPGLHARQLTSPAARAAPNASSGFWLTVAAILLLGGVAAGLWLWSTPPDAVPLVAVPPALTQPAVSAPLAPSAVASTALTVSPLVTAMPIPMPVRIAVRVPVPVPLARASASQTAPPLAPLLSELSEDLRRQIPALAITGAVYSDNPGQRLLLVNNQVLTQGSLATPEVNLEEIGAKSSVFIFRGTRFRLAH